MPGGGGADGLRACLTDDELADLTGRPQKSRQVEWLRRFGWRFAVRSDGRPRVARAYFDKRMAGAAETPDPAFEPDFAPLRAGA